METVKLFYEDSHLREMDAKVVAVKEERGCFYAALDRTVFFPEGGGQYADTGTLGEAEVLDVQEKDGVVWHKVSRSLQEGTSVHGRICWEERFEKMQQHTGEHIVSGLVHERFGYDNVGFHLGGDYCTLDFNGPISEEELREIEWEANQAAAKNLDIEVTYPSKEALTEMEYRSKIEIEGQVRIVTVPGYDVCACCAPHVKKTGEIGMIKLVNMTNYKGGQRITMLCGFRALRDYRVKLDNAKRIGAMLCEKENQIAGAVERIKEEQGMWKTKAAALESKLLKYQAADVPVKAEGITSVFDKSLSGNSPRELMNLLLERGADICAVFAGTEGGYRYVIGSRTKDVRPVGKELNAAFAGRGGGRPEMIQGSLTGKEDAIRKALDGLS